MASHTPPLGFIGTGLMGEPMAMRLLHAGFQLTVHSRTMARAERLLAAGAVAASSPAEVGASAEIVITMVPDSPDVEQVVGGKGGLLEAARPGLTWIDMSTISPTVARTLAAACQAAGVDCLDAPVSGGTRAAADGTLSIMAGGPRAVFERCFPVLQTLGQNIVHVGDTGAGQVTKACNQVVIAATLAGVAEALVLARCSDVDLNLVRDALLGGFAASRVLEVHGQRMIERTFEPGFFIRLHRKDLRIALDLASAVGAAVPATAIVAQTMNASVGSGDGSLDHSGIVRVFERLASIDPDTDAKRP